MYRTQLMTGLLILSAAVASCQSESTQNTPEYTASVISDSLRSPFPYNLKNPARSYELPSELVEISGLAFSSDSSLLMVQDEIGVVFTLDLLSGDVNRHIRFAGNGDFEGITSIGGYIWVIRSDGKLYGFYDEATEDAEDEKWELDLPSGGDYETLTVFPDTDKILVVGKEPVEVNDREEDVERPFFSFSASDPAERALEFILDLREIDAYLDEYGVTEGLEALQERFKPKKKSSCKPSGMAIHPETGHIYVVASVGKLLFVLNREGLVLHVRGLTDDLFPQPEGLCFGPDGTLYISHEGVHGKARVHAFPPLNIR